MAEREIPCNTAKQQLVKINNILQSKHFLIGGLAVQQYVATRNSADIDLICDHETANEIIRSLYPSKDYDVTEINKDDLRPAYVIKDKIKKEKVIYLGPKLTERGPYKYINWDDFMSDSQAFNYQNKTLTNILVPCIEALAFTKLLSFLSRIKSNNKKGLKDLADFIDLSNDSHFSLNSLITLIKASKSGDFIKTELHAIRSNYDTSLWRKSSLSEFCDMFAPCMYGIIPSLFESINFNTIYHPDNSIVFYDRVAQHYDVRNTTLLYDGHNAIIQAILDSLPGGGTILDLGCGTGRLIAAHFIHDGRFSWIGIDGSKNMLELFKYHTKKSKMKIQTINENIKQLNWETLTSVDLGMICFTLSSIDCMDVVKELAGKVKDNGVLLVADIHPSKTIKSPYYDFMLSDKIKIALKPKPVYPDQIMAMLIGNGYSIESHKIINDENGENYAFLTVYRHKNST